MIGTKRKNTRLIARRIVVAVNELRKNLNGYQVSTLGDSRRRSARTVARRDSRNVRSVIGPRSRRMVSGRPRTTHRSFPVGAVSVLLGVDPAARGKTCFNNVLAREEFVRAADSRIQHGHIPPCTVKTGRPGV